MMTSILHSQSCLSFECSYLTLFNYSYHLCQEWEKDASDIFHLFTFLICWDSAAYRISDHQWLTASHNKNKTQNVSTYLLVHNRSASINVNLVSVIAVLANAICSLISLDAQLHSMFSHDADTYWTQDVWHFMCNMLDCCLQ